MNTSILFREATSDDATSSASSSAFMPVSTCSPALFFQPIRGLQRRRSTEAQKRRSAEARRRSSFVVLQRLAESVKHLRYVTNTINQRGILHLVSVRFEEIEIPNIERDLEKNINFRNRTFSDVRFNRDTRTTELTHETVLLVSRELASHRIDD